MFSDRTQDTEGREASAGPNRRPRRPEGIAQAAATNEWGRQAKSGVAHYSEPDFGDDEDDEDTEAADDGYEHMAEDEESEDDDEFDEDEVMVDDLDVLHEKKSLIIKLPMLTREPPPSQGEDAVAVVDG